MMTGARSGILIAALLIAHPGTADVIPAKRSEAGAAIYATECASCHGEALEGQPNWQEANEDGTMPAPPHDVTGHTWHHPDSLLVTCTKLGGEETLRQMGVTGFKSAMPGFGDRLSDTEIREVLSYIKAHWTEGAQAYQAERTREQDGS
jgi:mono/diheme cytochrome c family protein